MQQSHRLIATVFLCAIASGVAQGQVPEFDLNGDGRVDRPEFVAGRDARFARFDRNKDAMISNSDFPASSRSLPLRSKVGQLLSAADLNRDGKLTRTELGTSGTPLFDRADTDGNSRIEGAELTNLKNLLRNALLESEVR
jgi:EF hand